ncbi:MAG: peptidase domain-containing ABC transporter [Polyangiaceae bacterium]
MSTGERSIFREEAIERYASRDEVPSSPERPSPARSKRRVTKHRVPVVHQQGGLECGIACLAMILGFHGRKTTLSECRRDFSPGRDGVTASMLLRLARSFGLVGKGLSVSLEGLAEIGQPVIAHWGFEHFVVVEWATPEEIGVVDPAAGRRIVSREEASAMFTGVVLVLAPGAGFERRRKAPAPAWRPFVTGLLRRSRGALSKVLVASAVIQGFGLALPVLTQAVIDELLPSARGDLLSLAGAGIAIGAVAFGAVSWLRSRMLVALQGALDEELMMGHFRHVLTLPYAFFQQRSTGDLLGRLHANQDIREILTGQTISLVLDGSMVLVYLGVLFVKAPLLAVATLGLGAAQMGSVLFAGPRIRRLMDRELFAQAESQTFLVEAIKGVATIKVSGNEEETFRHWSKLFQRTLRLSVERARWTGTLDSGLSALRMVGPLLLLWIGAQKVMSGSLTMGTMLALCALASMVLVPLSSLAGDLQRLQLVTAHLDRLGDVLEAEPEQHGRTVAEAPSLTGAIELKGVSFRYDAGAPWVLREIDVRVEPGKKVALVGKSGSGKSTLAHLLLGLYEATEGAILFDGRALSELRAASVRRQIGVVLQEPFLFGGTLRDNIALGGRDRSMESVVAAARLAAIHEEIRRMPMGYQTRVSEGTGGLSGGQRQRIAIARALLGKPPILLFDEATSHLDTVTERRVDEAISGLHCTRIVIAHRLSTVRDAELILVLDEGKIVARGTHESLLAESDVYRDLVSGAGEAKSE